MVDRDLDCTAGQYAQEAAPIMPGCTAARIIAVLEERTYLVEGLDVVGMLAEREFDLRLFEHGVDTAQPVHLRVGQQIEAVERVVEVSQCLAVGPAALRLLSGQDRVINRLLGLVAAAEVKRQ